MLDPVREDPTEAVQHVDEGVASSYLRPRQEQPEQEGSTEASASNNKRTNFKFSTHRRKILPTVSFMEEKESVLQHVPFGGAMCAEEEPLVVHRSDFLVSTKAIICQSVSSADSQVLRSCRAHLLKAPCRWEYLHLKMWRIGARVEAQERGRADED